MSCADLKEIYEGWCCFNTLLLPTPSPSLPSPLSIYLSPPIKSFSPNLISTDLLLVTERSCEMIGMTGGKVGDDSVAVADGRSWS